MSENLDLLLVNPGNRKSLFGNVSEYATVAQPLGIAMIASVVRNKGFNVKILDAEVENIGPEASVEKILDYNPGLVGLTTFTTKMTAAGQIASLLKERHPTIPISIGGHHVSAIPKRTLEEEDVDYTIKGEGYAPTLDLLTALRDGQDPRKASIPGLGYYSSDFKDGEIVLNPPGELMRELQDLPLPAWDLLPMKDYRAHHWQSWNRGNKNSFGLVYSSLGCPFSCGFCSVNVVYGKRGSRYLAPENFVSQIEKLVEDYSTEHIEIIDDTFTLNTNRIIEISDLLIERDYDLNMWCFARTDRTDPDMLSKMKRAGINWVFMGIESGTDATLEGVSKKQSIKQIKDAVKRVRDSGIYLGGNFIFGLPGETKESMQETLDFALDINPDWANFFIPMAYPGTQLYNNALGKGVLPRDWEQYGFFAPNAVALPTENLSSEEIISFRDRAFNTFFCSSLYQNQVEQKFGRKVKGYVQQMLTKKLERIENPPREIVHI